MSRRSDRRPVILLTGRHLASHGARRPEQTRLYASYYDAVWAAGGLPIIAPPLADEAAVERFLDTADGVLLTGGRDLPGRLFGQTAHPQARPVTRRRREFDLLLARKALERGMPVLGICLGIQVLNVAAGGTLHQHLPEQVPGGERHRARGASEAHPVILERGSLAARLTGRRRMLVNSTHHQAVEHVGRGLVVSAWSEGDGVVEALEARDRRRFVLGVQWHPERLIHRPEHLALFEGLVRAAASAGAGTAPDASRRRGRRR